MRRKHRRTLERTLCIKCRLPRRELLEARDKGEFIPCSDDGGHFYGDAFVAACYWNSRPDLTATDRRATTPPEPGQTAPSDR